MGVSGFIKTEPFLFLMFYQIHLFYVQTIFVKKRWMCYLRTRMMAVPVTMTAPPALMRIHVIRFVASVIQTNNSSVFNSQRVSLQLSVADLHSKILELRPPFGHKFFQFHAVFRNIWLIHVLAGSATGCDWTLSVISCSDTLFEGPNLSL